MHKSDGTILAIEGCPVSAETGVQLGAIYTLARERRGMSCASEPTGHIPCCHILALSRACSVLGNSLRRAGEQGPLARSYDYLRFFSPSETGFASPELAVASVFGFSCLGFFTSLFPRLLLPFPIATSHRAFPIRRHAGWTDPQENQGCLICVRAMTLMSCAQCQIIFLSSVALLLDMLLFVDSQGTEIDGVRNFKNWPLRPVWMAPFLQVPI